MVKHEPGKKESEKDGNNKNKENENPGKLVPV